MNTLCAFSSKKPVLRKCEYLKIFKNENIKIIKKNKKLFFKKYTDIKNNVTKVTNT